MHFQKAYQLIKIPGTAEPWELHKNPRLDTIDVVDPLPACWEGAAWED